MHLYTAVIPSFRADYTMVLLFNSELGQERFMHNAARQEMNMRMRLLQTAFPLQVHRVLLNNIMFYKFSSEALPLMIVFGWCWYGVTPASTKRMAGCLLLFF